MKMMKSLMSASLAVFMATGASAENIAIKGGTAFTNGGEGKVENALILVSEGKIQAVTAGGDVPSGYRTIDATGKWVTVGLMASGTNMGLLEVPSWAGDVDSRVKKAKSDIVVSAADAINPDTSIVGVTRIEGVTRVVSGLSSTGGMWKGRGAVLHLGNDDDLVAKSGAYIGLRLSGTATRAEQWLRLTTQLDKAKKAAEKAAKAEDDDKKKEPSAEDKILADILAGKLPVLLDADRADDLRKAIALKADYGLNIIVNGGKEGWRVADDLAAAGIPVVLSGTANLPNFNGLAATQANAGRLASAGVKIAFVGDGTHNARLMPQHAGNAVANGLSWADAMAAMTVNPAEIFGVADSYGTLEAGKDADIVVWDGDPIEVMSSPDAVLIKGEQIALESRQTKLRDRYKTITRSPAFNK